MTTWSETIVFWVKTLAVYVLVGPIIGYLVVAMAASVSGWLSGNADGAWLGPFMLLYGWLFAHLFGAPSALVAGVTACVLHLSLGRSAWWIGVASGCVAAFVVLMRKDLLPPFTGVVGVEIILIVTHIVAAHVSWMLVRPAVAATR